MNAFWNQLVGTLLQLAVGCVLFGLSISVKRYFSNRDTLREDVDQGARRLDRIEAHLEVLPPVKGVKFIPYRE